MKVVILAGGYGTRLGELTDIRPKPMVEIGGKPILWHIMKIYSSHGFNEFVILLGYKGYIIKEYFANYFLHQSDVTINLGDNSMEVHNNSSEPWKVTLIETGKETMTGGRIKQAKKYVGNEPFLCTYGDGVSNVNITELVKFHRSHGKLLTMTAIQPEGRYGALEFDGTRINSFLEKPKGDGSWINGGFFVCQPEVFSYIENNFTVFEKEPIETLAKEGNVMGYKHHDFWQCMDTLRDKNKLEELWDLPSPPWKNW
ncbi:MAG: glucose-1-phosphate cytidylyltransferase [Opitutaceae bacterium]|nr:glucose-1-phosphate cytidylyltransferase [Cytophagales bacterium]